MKCLMDVKWVCVSEPRMVVLVWFICVSLLSIERLADHNPKKKTKKTRQDQRRNNFDLDLLFSPTYFSATAAEGIKLIFCVLSVST